ncbi:MAG: hypothetical protein ABIQ74_11520 [Chitinophagales bacterium]
MIDLKAIEKRLDTALALETKSSMLEWLSNHQSVDSALIFENDLFYLSSIPPPIDLLFKNDLSPNPEIFSGFFVSFGSWQ